MKTKIIFLGLTGIAALLQFFPIDKALPYTSPEQELQAVYHPPDAVFSLLKHACYDCHSNNTRYPWYANIQPLGWWIQDHIEHGRSELNFSEIGRWNEAERRDLLEHCARVIEKSRMPLNSYVRMHPEAKLDRRQKDMLMGWLLHPETMSKLVKQPINAPPDSCDGDNENTRCCFAGMPDSLTSAMVIAGADEPGERLVIKGQVFRRDGKTPYPGVLIYAYHTDTHGIYSKNGTETGIRKWHGRLHGWCRTDTEGRYSIQSIRPAPYPRSDGPAHIHEVVWEPGKDEPYYINETVFEDDVHVTERYRKNERGPGGSGIIDLKRGADGIWTGRRDITLK